MEKRLKRLYSLPSIPSWILIVWKVVDRLDTMNFIMEQLNPILKFLSSDLGTILVLLVGFGILIYVVVRPEKKRNSGTSKQPTQEKPTQSSPLDKVFHDTSLKLYRIRSDYIWTVSPGHSCTLVLLSEQAPCII